MSRHNDKYIVFHREEWMNYVMADFPPEVEDAVVIRRQDIFAGPAFHAYAACISISYQVLSMIGDADQLGLQKIADYFHEQAVEADDLAGAGLAKLPD